MQPGPAIRSVIPQTHFISQAFEQLASRPFILRLAAGLSHEVNVSDDHVLADRLAHVVDGEEGNGGSHEGLHLDPRLAGALHPGK